MLEGHWHSKESEEPEEEKGRDRKDVKEGNMMDPKAMGLSPAMPLAPVPSPHL